MTPEWQNLLERAVAALGELKGMGLGPRDWSFGGGTALMIAAGHRDSRDIDIFLPDPQFLGLLSPRLNAPGSLRTEDYDESAHVLKLRFGEGEIDFIVARNIITEPTAPWPFNGFAIPLERPVEIALKKFVYRREFLKPRDIFDIAVVYKLCPDELEDNLHLAADAKAAVGRRLREIPRDFLRATLDDLAIRPEWNGTKADCLEVVQALVEAIPEPGT